MARCCEVCENFRPDAPANPNRVLVPVVFDVRTVVLCRAHARIAERSGVQSFEQLREFYGSGRRSYVPRRNPSLAEPNPERRRSLGRRASDRLRAEP